MTSKISVSDIVSTAKKDPALKEVLKSHYPELFEGFDLTKLISNSSSINSSFKVFSNEASIKAGFKNNDFFQIRTTGDYKGVGFYLSSECQWRILEDNYGQLVLVPNNF